MSQGEISSRFARALGPFTNGASTTLPSRRSGVNTAEKDHAANHAAPSPLNLSGGKITGGSSVFGGGSIRSSSRGKSRGKNRGKGSPESVSSNGRRGSGHAEEANGRSAAEKTREREQQIAHDGLLRLFSPFVSSATIVPKTSLDFDEKVRQAQFLFFFIYCNLFFFFNPFI